jgi:hypothetical protein
VPAHAFALQAGSELCDELPENLMHGLHADRLSDITVD